VRSSRELQTGSAWLMTEANLGGVSVRSIRTRILLAAFMFAGSGISAVGQSTNATLSGTVQDSGGAVVPNASVLATQVDTGEIRTTQSGPDGRYVITDLPIGKYSVTASSPGLRHWSFHLLPCRSINQR